MAGTAGMAGSAGAAGAGGGANCPADKGEFEIAGIGGRCFFLLTSSGGPQRTWDEAKNDCAQRQYALASLPSKAEYEAARTYLVDDLGVTNNFDASNSVWIGARTEEAKIQGSETLDDLAASYNWLDGVWAFNTASEAPWAVGQPSTERNGIVSEQCVEMRSEAPVFNFLMNNVSCTTPHGFALCERPFSR
jgi:lectin-like protein